MLKLKGLKNIYNVDTNQKLAGVAILKWDKVYFWTKYIVVG